MNLVLAHDFEGTAAPPWNLLTSGTGTAAIDDSQGAYEGSQALALVAGGDNGTAEGWISLVLTGGLRPAPLIYRVKWDGEADYDLIVRMDNGAGGYITLEIIPTASLTKNVWSKRTVTPPVATGTAGRLSFWIDASAPPHGFGPTKWAIDLVDLEDNRSSSIARFARQLKDVIAAVDDAIGSIYISKKRWLTQDELEADAVLPISAVGPFDLGDQVGLNATRFWIIDPRVETKPLTNGSNEYEHVIAITGFFQRGVGESQETSLRTAATLILDSLGRKTVEMGTQNLNPGTDGYMGYLGVLPRMLTPVTNAKLDEAGIQGHVVQLEMRYFEEVTRS